MTRTVLIADDSQFMRFVLKKILEKNGFEVVADVENGMKAVEQYKAVRPDLVTMDVVMPGMNGVELAERIKMARPDVAVLFVSGYAQDELLRRGTNFARGNLLLIKPFNHESLLRYIRQVLDSAKDAFNHGAD